MDHDTAVKAWRQKARLHDEENYEFLRSLKFRDYGYDPDELAGEPHRVFFGPFRCWRRLARFHSPAKRDAGMVTMEVR